MNVKTKIGNISVIEATDPTYPGVYIEVNGVQLVLVEYDNGEGKHVVRVWNHKEADNDYEYKQVIE